MKKILSLFLIITCIFSLVGCSKTDNSNKNKFIFATWAAGTELREFQAIIDRVNEKANGDYIIEVQSIPSDYYVKLSTQIAGKRTPDFFWMTQELVSKYAKMGAIADLTEQFGKSERLKPEQYIISYDCCCLF